MASIKSTFIPTIWATRILSVLKNKLVFGQSMVVNTDYEGEIREKGNTVKINHVGAVTISDYVSYTDMAKPEQLAATQTTLTIDRQKSFHFFLDIIDARHGNPGILSKGMEQAAYGLGNETDAYLGKMMATDTNLKATHKIGSDSSPKKLALTTSPESLYKLLGEANVLLDRAKIPEEGRVCVAPTEVFQILGDTEVGLDRETPLGDTVVRNGWKGMLRDFNMLKSNNVYDPNDDETGFVLIVTHPMAVSFANTVPPNTMRTYEPERAFGTAAKGLHVYGADLIRPEAIVTITVDTTSTT